MRIFILAFAAFCLLASTTIPDPAWAAGARIDDNGNP